jgi:hypothetical protein
MHYGATIQQVASRKIETLVPGYSGLVGFYSICELAPIIQPHRYYCYHRYILFTPNSYPSYEILNESIRRLQNVI